MFFPTKTNIIRLFIIVLVLSTLISLPSSTFAQSSGDFFLTQGIASGDVTSNSAIVWSRVNRDAEMNVQYDSDQKFSHPESRKTLVNHTTDFTGHIKIEGLVSNTLYYYRIWFTSHSSAGQPTVSNSVIGTFRTAPDESARKSVDFVIGGDLGGQGFCRRIGLGYTIFSIMKDIAPDFFIFSGDQIYAGSMCPRHQLQNNAVGWQNIPATFPSVRSAVVNWTDLSQLHEVYREHWEYNRNDSHLQALLRNTSMYSQFDDHEVIDNSGGNWEFLPGEFENRMGYTNLVATGLSIFSEFSPINADGREQGHFYRSFNWGKDLDLFLLDTRSYRNSNAAVEDPGNNKSLLGKQQLKWLKEGLLFSNSTWKIISITSPVTIPKCSYELGCDNWATTGNSSKSFATERSEFLKFLDDNNIVNVVFVVTDVHFPANIVVKKDFNGDGDELIFYELTSGPLSARPFDAGKLDPTINATFLYNESKIFNFAHVRIYQDTKDNNVHLVSKVIDENGIVRPNSSLDLLPQP
jgi:alkaline phosphatase D